MSQNGLKQSADLLLQDLPYEKYRRLGPSYLTEAELLAIVIRSGIKDQSALEIAKRVLLLGKSPRTGLLGLYDASLEDLQEIPGIGPVNAIRLKALTELSMRLSRANREAGISVHDPSTVADYFMEEMRHLDREVAVLVSLDAKCRIVAKSILSEGSVNMSLVSPRSVFLEALGNKAVCMILLHNHPSGDPTPSRADIDVTQKLFQLGEMMELPLLDHIVIGDNCYYSFKEHPAL